MRFLEAKEFRKKENYIAKHEVLNWWNGLQNREAETQQRQIGNDC
jgi:hypothetical protein